ncbi:ribonuclease P protein subunit p38-like [Gigantopelta aegis]|uniref:ribonuclease P protein subunit p38-like n=1 Tax=Gigantopelta aegis TaxID=1735272 RepID=UPI001B88BF48|nr:ribonuclease P protein subunit p38-like [Gigantopelta aegis]
MAAPTLSEKEARRSLREKSKVQKSKAHLINPYSHTWPILDELVIKEVIERISNLFQCLPLHGQKIPWKEKQKKKELLKNGAKIAESEDERKRKDLRSQLAIGINAVTRGLEKDDLDLVIVCQSTEPQLITKHLIPLSACRQCPTLCIPRFSEAVAPLLGIKSTVGIGFKKLASKEESEFSEFVSYGKTCAIPISMPWDEDTKNITPLVSAKEAISVLDSKKSIQDDENKEKILNSKALDTGKSDSIVQNKETLLKILKTEKQDSVTDNEVETKNIIHTDKSETGKSDSSLQTTEKCSQISSPKKKTEATAGCTVQTFIPKDDYSYLYVFKSEKKKSKDWGEFVPLGEGSDSSDSETFCYKSTAQQEAEETQDLASLKMKKRQHENNQNDMTDNPSDVPPLKYQKTKIGQQFKNPNKPKRRKKLGK